MTALFTLDPQLAADTRPVGRLALSRLLLTNDARYAWLILVPEKPHLAEIIDLDGADRALLMEEIAAVSHALRRAVAPEKLNVGAIGNKVRQLHIHIVARVSTDAAWPAPVWGHGSAQPYDPAAATRLIAAIASHLELASIPETTGIPA